MVLPTTSMKQNTHLIMPMSENKKSNGGNGWQVNLHVEFQKNL
jgi:hypothetical protein